MSEETVKADDNYLHVMSPSFRRTDPNEGLRNAECMQTAAHRLGHRAEIIREETGIKHRDAGRMVPDVRYHVKICSDKIPFRDYRRVWEVTHNIMRERGLKTGPPPTSPRRNP